MNDKFITDRLEKKDEIKMKFIDPAVPFTPTEKWPIIWKSKEELIEEYPMEIKNSDLAQNYE